MDGVLTDINKPLENNRNFTFSKNIYVPPVKEITQPYWLKEKMDEGHFHIADQQMIGVADVEPAYVAKMIFTISGTDFTFEKPVKYRATDPVKGEVYQPLYVIPQATLTTSPDILIFDKKMKETRQVVVELHPNKNIAGNITVGLTGLDAGNTQKEQVNLLKGNTRPFRFNVSNLHASGEESVISGFANQRNGGDTLGYYLAMRSIEYDHIPSVKYFYPDFIKSLNIDLKIAGKKIGYVPGAGDKVAEILTQLGYQVTILDRPSLASANLATFDAIITGVRAYNTNEWMNDYYERLMTYVKNGGNLIIQYNTSNNIGQVRARIGPFNFDISRSRITDENAKVTTIVPNHKVLNFPNKITGKDFEGWIQERSIYQAANWDTSLQPILSMADPNEAATEGSLLIGKYGKGYFTYTGVVFFRELPAAVPGAFRLMANLIGLNQTQTFIKK